MRRAAASLALVPALVPALAGCGSAESTTVAVTETRTATETETVVETATVAVGLPEEVATTHAALLEAAEAGDYEALRPLIGDDFSYSFGAPDEGPVEYWQRLERETDERPLEILARILRLPYTVVGGSYVWPFAYDKEAGELTAYERELLGDLADDYAPGGGYLGWRTGIEPDGRWAFFIAGD